LGSVFVKYIENNVLSRILWRGEKQVVNNRTLRVSHGQGLGDTPEASDLLQPVAERLGDDLIGLLLGAQIVEQIF
jgi:hypothetical protein